MFSYRAAASLAMQLVAEIHVMLFQLNTCKHCPGSHNRDAHRTDTCWQHITLAINVYTSRRNDHLLHVAMLIVINMQSVHIGKLTTLWCFILTLLSLPRSLPSDTECAWSYHENWAEATTTAEEEITMCKKNTQTHGVINVQSIISFEFT